MDLLLSYDEICHFCPYPNKVCATVRGHDGKLNRVMKQTKKERSLQLLLLLLLALI